MRDQIQREAVEAGLKPGNWTLVLPVRSGKTKCGWEISKNFKNVLVCYPNNPILKSWEEDAVKFGYNTNNVKFTTFLSIDKYNLANFDLVIIDEVQDFSVNCWEYLTSFNINKLICLTATPPNRGEKQVFLNKYCPITYEVSLDDTVEHLQKDYKIIVHLLEPSSIKDIPLSKGRTWSEKAKINFWENKYKTSRNFMDMLKLIQTIQNSTTKLNYLAKLSSKLDKCIIFLETKQQCDILNFPSYYSGNKYSEQNLKDFNNNVVNKLACIKQLSAGVQFPNLNKAIILHAYASNNKFHQRFGRILSLVNNTETTAEVHLLCLKGTKDEQWCQSALEEFNKDKIQWKII